MDQLAPKPPVGMLARLDDENGPAEFLERRRCCSTGNSAAGNDHIIISARHHDACAEGGLPTGIVMARADYNVVIAGGGIAGAAAAAAFKEFGWSVLVVEPGQHADRRLGGELIHPAGVCALKELGLFEAKAFRDAIPIAGFVAFPGCGENDIKLPYAENWGLGHAIALDHARLRAALQNAAEALPHVTMLKGGRVVGARTATLRSASRSNRVRASGP